MTLLVVCKLTEPDAASTDFCPQKNTAAAQQRTIICRIFRKIIGAIFIARATRTSQIELEIGSRQDPRRITGYRWVDKTLKPRLRPTPKINFLRPPRKPHH